MQTSIHFALSSLSSASSVAVVSVSHHLIVLIYLSTLQLKMVSSASVDYCYSDIGCFPLSAEFFHPKHRPFNVRPLHRQHIRTQFELFNRDHPEGFIIEPWNKLSLSQSKFNPKLETKVIIPGWLDNINRALWVRKLKDALVWLWAPVNVIVVRWTNFTPYTIATANSRVVGAELANLMKFIDRELAYDPAYYHIIGHSLGAHIAGYCGDRVHGLGRITALDPARPFFQHMPKSVRLDRSDAKFVDAIHSDFTPENAIFLLMSYGMTTPVGHLDFYPNGPPLFQPGCMRDTLLSVQNGIARGLQHNSLSIAFLESVRYLTACDHQRSHEWFIESITNRECAFVGVRCNEFEGMINGRCTCDDSPSACAIMGIHADQMYLHNVHEELWPVRSGSIEYKYKRPSDGGRPPKIGTAVPLQPQMVSLDMTGEVTAFPLPPTLETTKGKIYKQLKHEADQVHKKGEPKIALSTQDFYPQVSNQAAAPTDLTYADSIQYDQVAEPSELDDIIDTQIAALNDMAFVGYLRSNLLIDQLNKLKGEGEFGERRNDSRAATQQIDKREDSPQGTSAGVGHPDQYEGHPELASGFRRDIESWYEDNSRWHLKTNNQPKYCSNQYQLLIYLGPLKTSSGRDKLRANLVVSIIGSRGQLLNQRFVPRGATLTSFTMQPFFILLEGSYSLGSIKSVALSWEARNDPDPIQATVSFQSSAVQQIGQNVPAYKAKQFPWMPEETKYDKSSNFRWHRSSLPPPPEIKTPMTIKYSRQKRPPPLSVTASQALKASIGGHYSRKYPRSDQEEAARRSGLQNTDLLVAGECTARSKTTDCMNGAVAVDRLENNTPEKARVKRSGDQKIEVESSKDLQADASEHDYEDDEQELDDEQQQQLAELIKLKSFNRMQALDLLQDSTLASVLGRLQGQNKTVTPSQQSTKPSKQPVDDKASGQQNIDQDEQSDLLNNPASSYNYFVPLIDPLDKTAIYKPPPGSNIPPELLVDHDGEVKIDLHNIDLRPSIPASSVAAAAAAAVEEDSIVINHVILSPIQATYGRRGRNAKTFCPPEHKQRLVHDQTIKLVGTFFSKCSQHNLYQQHLQQEHFVDLA